MTSEFIDLRHGPTLPAAVVHLAVSLEAQGFEMTNDAGTLRLSRSDGQVPADVLAAEDRSAIIRWKLHLLAVVDYCAQNRAMLGGENGARTKEL